MAQAEEITLTARDATKTFWTEDGGIKVSLMKLDNSKIIAIPAQCIVCYLAASSSNTETLSSYVDGDDVSRTIALSIWNSGKACNSVFEAKRTSLGVTKVFNQHDGNRWKKVIFAFGPEWSDIYDQGRQGQLTDTIFNCLTEIYKLRLHTVVLPFFSCVPTEIGASCYVEALARFVSGEKPLLEGEPSLEHVIFVSDDPGRVSALCEELTQNLVEDTQETLRMVLVGKTGVGKSDTGNSILGDKKFDVAQQATPVTGISSFGAVSRIGCDIQVVDTPGIFDNLSAIEQRNIIKEILRSIIFTLPGPHVFVLVLSGDDRFDTVDNEIITKMKEMFSQEFLRFVMIVFTHVQDQKKLDKLLENNNNNSVIKSVKALIAECGGRVLCIENDLKKIPQGLEGLGQDVIKMVHNNRMEQLDGQVNAITKMALELREKNRLYNAPGKSGPAVDYYTDKLTSRCVQVLQTSSGSRPLDKIKEAVKKGDEELVKMLKRDDQIRTQAEKNITYGCVVL